jgi:hypothetical protein
LFSNSQNLLIISSSYFILYLAIVKTISNLSNSFAFPITFDKSFPLVKTSIVIFGKRLRAIVHNSNNYGCKVGSPPNNINHFKLGIFSLTSFNYSVKLAIEI